MRRPDLRVLGLLGFVACGLAGSAQARERPPKDAGVDAGSSASATAAQAPPLAESSDDELPEGHPEVGDTDENPHAHAGAHAGKNGAVPGVFEPPEDVEKADPSLAAGSIAVELHDAEDHPVPNEIVTLGGLIHSIAKGG